MSECNSIPPCVHFMKENSARGANCWKINKTWPRGHIDFEGCTDHLSAHPDRFDDLTPEDSANNQTKSGGVDTLMFRKKVRDGMTIKEASEAAGVGICYTPVLATKFGIKLKKKETIKIKDIERLISEGKSNKEIAKELGCQPCNITKRAKLAGIETNRYGGVNGRRSAVK